MDTRSMKSRRRGISLVEVLISMFVLAIGLLGVAALIPAGRHEIVEATKLETAAMVGRNAFRDLQVREYMKPNRWARNFVPTTNYVYPTGDLAKPFTVRSTTGATENGIQAAYAFDPLGRMANYGFGFPYSSVAASNPVKLMRIFPIPTATTNSTQALGAYDLVFRSSVDLVTEPNANKDLPPLQRGTLRRESYGNYSWLATVVSDPSRIATTGQVTVSVAVFYKRDLSAAGAGEYVSQVKSFPVVPMTSGGEVVIENVPTVNGRIRPLKPGQWIMLAGVTTTAPARSYYRWYRVLSAANYDAAAATQSVTLSGQDWTIPTTPTNTIQVQAWIFDNIVSVYEKSMPLEIE